MEKGENLATQTLLTLFSESLHHIYQGKKELKFLLKEFRSTTSAKHLQGQAEHRFTPEKHLHLCRILDLFSSCLKLASRD